MNESELAEQAEEKIRGVLSEISMLGLGQSRREVAFDVGSKQILDLLIPYSTQDGEHRLLVEIKSGVQPRMIPAIEAQLRSFRQDPEREHFMLYTDFVSERSAQVCKEYAINYMDAMGNCWIALPSIHVEVKSAERPKRERRELRSLFSEKSSRVLNVILSNGADRHWKISELAERCEISLGLASRVKQKLLDEGYAETGLPGIRLLEPGQLLSDWARQYSRKIIHKKEFYTLLNESEKTEAFQEAALDDADVHCTLSGFSAAKWIAPYAKANIDSFYADKEGEQGLVKLLDLKEVDSGANVVIEYPKDPFVLKNSARSKNGIRHVNDVQTFLDLCTFGERGQEAAEHLLHQVIMPRWEG